MVQSLLVDMSGINLRSFASISEIKGVIANLKSLDFKGACIFHLKEDNIINRKKNLGWQILTKVPPGQVALVTIGSLRDLAPQAWQRAVTLALKARAGYPLSLRWLSTYQNVPKKTCV